MRLTDGRWLAHAVLASLLFAATALTLTVVGNEDLWWYLPSGEEILRRGAVPDSDPFLYTSAESATWATTGREQGTWVRHSWLWTVALALLHRAFGVDGLAALQALFVGGVATLVFTRARVGPFGLVSGVVTAAVLVASVDRLTLRAEVAGWLLFAVYLALLDRARPLGTRTALLVVALQWLWSNLHGSYVLGIGLGFAYSLGGTLQRGRPAPAPLWLGPALCVASIATPGLGPERVLEAVALLTRLFSETAGEYPTRIVEWQATYAGGFGVLAGMHLVTTAVGLLGFALARPPRSLPRALVFVGMGLLGVSAVRFVSGFALATGMITLSNLRGVAWRSLAPSLRRALSSAEGALAVAFCALMIVTGLTRLASNDALEVSEIRPYLTVLDPVSTAPGAADWLRARRPVGPIFNDVEIGGYLIHALYPDHQLFIDSRNLSAEVLDDYSRALFSPEHWRALEQRYGFGVVVLGNLMRPSVPLRRVLATDPSWQLGYLDPQAVVFVKRKDEAPPPTVRARGAHGGLPFLDAQASGWASWARGDHAGLLANYLSALLELRRPGEALEIADEAFRAQPHELSWLRARARAHLQLGDLSGALEDYALLLERAPASAGDRYFFAVALYRSGRPRAALEQLDRVQQLDPRHALAPRLRRAAQRALAGARVPPPAN